MDTERPLLARLPGYAPVRFARMAGSSIAAPDAAGWIMDFLNAAFFARPPELRAVDDLRLAFAIVTTRWAQLDRRLRLWDVASFHRAFGLDRLVPRAGSWGTLSRDQLLAGAERLHGGWFAPAYADPRRRGWGVVFRDPAQRAAYEPERRLECAALGELTPPRASAPEQEWSTYPPVPLPSLPATLALLAEPARWPDFGSELGRFTALRSGGLEGQTFEIEVVAHPLPRTPLFTRAYVTVTGIYDAPGEIVRRLASATAILDEPPLPPGAHPRFLLELTTHEGHFLGAAVSRILLYERGGEGWVRDVGQWDPLPLHLQAPFWLAGRAAQHAFWGGGDPSLSLLHQLGAVAREEVASA